MNYDVEKKELEKINKKNKFLKKKKNIKNMSRIWYDSSNSFLTFKLWIIY